MPTGNRLSDMEFDEISLVTRPANQLSKVVLYKGDMNMPDTDAEFDTEDGLDPDLAKGGKYKKGHGREHDDDDDESEEDEALKNLKKDDAELASLLDYVETLEAANDDLMSKLEEEYEEGSDFDELLKSADPALVEIIKATEERAVMAEEIAKAERDYRVEREFIAKAADYASLPIHPEEFGPVLKAAAEALTEEQFTALSQVLAASNEAIATGGVFDEIGRSAAFDADSSMGRIEQAAKQLQTNDGELSREAAIAKAVSADPTLYDAYLKENR